MTGTAVSAGMKTRILQLEKLTAMINEMEILIRFRAMRVSELINELSSQEVFRNFLFLNILNECMNDESMNVNECWCIAAKKSVFLSDSDKRILYNIGEQLGSTDIDGQLSMLVMNKALAQRNLIEAEEEFRIKGKMFRNVWGLCGIAAGIMLI